MPPGGGQPLHAIQLCKWEPPDIFKFRCVECEQRENTRQLLRQIDTVFLVSAELFGAFLGRQVNAAITKKHKVMGHLMRNAADS